MPSNSNWFSNPTKKFEDTRKAVKRDHPKEYGVADKIVNTIAPILLNALVEALTGSKNPQTDQKAPAPAPK